MLRWKAETAVHVVRTLVRKNRVLKTCHIAGRRTRGWYSSGIAAGQIEFDAETCGLEADSLGSG